VTQRPHPIPEFINAFSAWTFGPHCQHVDTHAWWRLQGVWKDSRITARGHHCLQGGHNGRGDPCETSHLWKRWGGLLCGCGCVWVCVGVCAEAYFCIGLHTIIAPFVYDAIIVVVLSACASSLLPSSFLSARLAQDVNHLPHCRKELTEAPSWGYKMTSYDSLCTHPHTNKQTWLRMEGGAHHTLTVSSLLLTQTHFEHVPTDSADGDVGMHTLSGDRPTVDGKLDP